MMPQAEQKSSDKTVNSAEKSRARVAATKASRAAHRHLSRTPSKRRYSKVSRRMWNDARFQALSAPPPNAQTLWQRLLTGPELSQVPGLIAVSRGHLADRLGWTLEGLDGVWREIEAQGMAHADWRAGLVYLPSAIKHNRPDNPNVVRSWLIPWDELPECPLKASAYYGLRSELVSMGERFVQAFDDVCPEPGEVAPKGSATEASPGWVNVAPKGSATHVHEQHVAAHGGREGAESARPPVAEKGTELAQNALLFPLFEGGAKGFGEPSPKQEQDQEQEQEQEIQIPPTPRGVPEAAPAAGGEGSEVELVEVAPDSLVPDPDDTQPALVVIPPDAAPVVLEPEPVAPESQTRMVAAARPGLVRAGQVDRGTSNFEMSFLVAAYEEAMSRNMGSTAVLDDRNDLEQLRRMVKRCPAGVNRDAWIESEVDAFFAAQPLEANRGQYWRGGYGPEGHNGWNKAGRPVWTSPTATRVRRGPDIQKGTAEQYEERWQKETHDQMLKRVTGAATEGSVAKHLAEIEAFAAELGLAS